LKSSLIILIAFGTALFTGCSDHTAGVPMGGGHDGETFSGTIIHQDGFTASNTQVQLMPEDYDPFADAAASDSGTFIDTTGSDGVYVFANVPVGTYNLQALHLTKRTSTLIRNVEITKGNPVRLPIQALKPPGTMIVSLPDTLEGGNGYVFIPGTNVFTDDLVQIRSGYYAVLDSVPAADEIKVLFAEKTDASEEVPVLHNISLSPGDTVGDFPDTSLYARWNSSGRIVLNTSSTGADVPGEVTGFPVLVRLDASNFPFSEAKPNGEDVRFSKADGMTPLTYEIERWDSAAELAAVWVRADTVYGSNITQYFYMYWGNADASDRSDGQAVFDTSLAFEGVWHLSESGNSDAEGYRDATVNALHGTGTGLDGSSDVSGIIGRAQEFSGAGENISGPMTSRLRADVSFSASLWMSWSPMPERSWVASFGGYMARDSSFHFLIWPDSTAQFGFWHVPEGEFQNMFPFADYVEQWTHAAMVYEAATGILRSFINGSVVDTDTVSNIYLDLSDGFFLCLNRHDWESPYKGMLDEVRVSTTNRSPDWIRLSYENQKPDQTLISVVGF
jgi:hypothetical protein